MDMTGVYAGLFEAVCDVTTVPSHLKACLAILVCHKKCVDCSQLCDCTMKNGVGLIGHRSSRRRPPLALAPTLQQFQTSELASG